MTIETIQRELRAFADERDWSQFHNPKNLVMALTGEMGELAELFQWLTPDEAAAVMDDARRAERVREEIADVFGYVLRLADVLEIDLQSALAAKIEVNATKYPVDLSRGSAAKYTDLVSGHDS
jgi:dCTP diphosphatase